MNEQIEKLAEQAGLEFDDDEALEFGKQIYYVTKEDMEKFAELIVKECVSLMEWQKISPKDVGAYNSALSLAQRNIKEQFGVEE